MTAMIDLHEYKERKAGDRGAAGEPAEAVNEAGGETTGGADEGAHKGTAAGRDELVARYMPLVHYVVHSLSFSLPPMLDGEDLVSYGTMGLLNALDRYDAVRGVKFETYAVTRIRGYIIDQLRALDPLPRSARQRTRQIERAREEMERALGRAPTAEEVARHVGLDRGKYDQALRDASCVTLSLDALMRPDEDDTPAALLHLVRDTSSPSPDASAEAHDLRDTVSSAMRALSERERRLLHLYYYEERTLQEISRVLEVSESRVCQIHTQALKRLRTVIAA